MNCWCDLKIDTTRALKPGWILPYVPKRTCLQMKEATEVLSPAWLAHMDQLGYPISTAIVFYKTANCVQDEAHIDVNIGNISKPQLFAFNWVLSGFDSMMIWYEQPSTNPTMVYNDSNVPYSYWPTKVLTVIDSKQVMNTMTAVRTDIPHSIANGKEDRWTISARTDVKFVSWEVLISDFQRKGLL